MYRMLVLSLIVCLLCLPPLGPAQVAPAEEKPKTSDSKVDAAKPTDTKPTVVRITLSGDYPEGPVRVGLFGKPRKSLADVIRRIDHAAEDKEVAALWLRIEALKTGRGKVHELRAAVQRFRKSGKPVYAELATAQSNQYLVAAACDQIIMPPCGILIVPGVRAEVTFYKGLLEKLGIEFELLQMGKYKGAVEPLTRTDMSPPLRESIEALIDDAYEDMVAVIAADRQMKGYKVKTLLDQGLFTAAAARKAGLIDRVCYADQLQDALRKKLQADKIKLVTDYKKKKVDTDFSGITGMMKLVELLIGGKPAKATGKKPKIAVIHAVGMIIEGKSATNIFGTRAVGSTTLVKALRKAAEDQKVVGIVLRIDSPGGSGVASDLIWRETVRIKKPIIASMGDKAASGGYYIAMGADKILAEPQTITGSIGVFGGKVVLRGLYEKIGVTTEIISRGQNSGSLATTDPFTPEERKAWMVVLKEAYRQFVGNAAKARELAYKDLEKLAQGRVYTGRMAKANGLIDELGTLKDAIAEAKKAAGLKPDAEVELMILPRPKTIFEQLFSDTSVSTGLEATWPELLETVRKAKLFRRLFSEPVLLWMPYRLELR